MWVLLTMSVVTVTLVFERAWFWATTNGPTERARVARMERMLRDGDVAGAKVLAQDDRTIYGKVVLALLEEGYSDALATAVIERQRPRFDRYMSTLSTMITAAPLAGLLGTVVGLISTFKLLSDQMVGADPRSVGVGLSEAMLNTAGGLMVAIIAIFPYNFYRTQIDRALGRLESLLAAAARGHNADSLRTPSQKPNTPA